MSRFRRAFHGVASSYILLAATAFYSLASVPVALHYLAPPPDHDPKRFGLWIIMGTLAGYLNLIDAGMTSAAARLLIDHKDDKGNGNYGSFIKTGWLVSALQGAFIFLAGWLLTVPLIALLAIQADMRLEFTSLMHWQCGALALLFSARIFALILQAHQRMDLANYIGAVSLAVNFAAQWIFFHFGFGVVSLALGSLVAAVVSVVLHGVACSLLKLFPQAGDWGKATWRHFLELFNFGKDFFLVSVGNQLIVASQVFVISRLLGPAEVAIWGIGLRVFNLLNQMIWRISDMSAAMFAEMLTRGEIARARERYQTICTVSFSLSAAAAVAFALCNSLFIPIWTAGKSHWPMTNNCLLAIWMIVTAVTHCHNNFILMTKQMRFLRYLFFVEGVFFVILSCWLARWGGLAAIIGCSIVCGTMFSGVYGVWRISRFFELSIREVAVDWMRPMFKMLLFLVPVAGIIWWGLSPLSDLPRLTANALLTFCLGTYLFLRIGIPVALQNELLRRIPAWAALVLRRIFARTAG